MFKNGIPPTINWSSGGGGGGGGSGSGPGTQANVNNAYFWNGAAGSSSRIGGGSKSNVIDFFDRTSSGVAAATDRGDDISTQGGARGCHDANKAYRMGKCGTSSFNSTNIAYIDLTVDNTNAVDSYDLGTYSYKRGYAALNGPVYGYCQGVLGVVQYMTLANMTGNTSSAGTLSFATYGTQGVSNTTYGHILAGWDEQDYGKEVEWTNRSAVDYIDVTTTSTNGTNRMNMFLARRLCGTISGGAYGFVCGGVISSGDSELTGTGTNAIEFFDNSTNSGAASDRSDLSVAMDDLMSNNDSQGFSHGLVGTGSTVDRLDMVTASADAVDRGDRTIDNKYATCAN